MSRWEGMEMGEARGMGFAMWEAEENGICGAIQTLLVLPKSGRDRVLRRPGPQEAWASTGIADSVASRTVPSGGCGARRKNTDPPHLTFLALRALQ